MSPEENMIVILQNVLMFIYSSIGYVMLLPFYEVRNVESCLTVKLLSRG